MMMIFGMLPIVLILFGVDLIHSFRRTVTERNRLSHGPRGKIFMEKQLDSTIFRLAKLRSGKISLSEVVVETGLNIKEAEQYMDSITDSEHVLLEIDGDGRLIYVFPELKGGSDKDVKV